MDTNSALLPRQHSTASSREGTLPRVHQPRSGNVAMNHIISQPRSNSNSPSDVITYIPPPPPPVSPAVAAAAASNYTNSRRPDGPGLPQVYLSPRYESKWGEPAMDGYNSYRTSNGGVVINANADSAEKGRHWDNYDIDTTSEDNFSDTKKYSDWRRSAVLTLFLFPPTGLIAMIAACISYSYGEKGKFRTAERYGRISCVLIFVSLLLSVALILGMILLRMYRIIESPF